MQINYFIGVSSILIILVFIIPFVYLRKKHLIPLKYFLWGMLAWAGAIIVKLLMDVTISPTILPLGIMIMALYAGLRTGVLESGISYLLAKKKLPQVSFYEAVAFGVGFGGLEAFLLGLVSLISFLLVVFKPDIFSSLPEDVYNQLLESYSGSSLIALAAVIERMSVIIIHVASILLVFKSIMSKNIRYLVYSILYKSFVDGIIPPLISQFGMSTVTGVYIVEAFVAALAVIGIFIISKTKPSFESRE